MLCFEVDPAVLALKQVVGIASAWGESDATGVTEKKPSGAQALRLELEWASHMSLQACILPLPQARSIAHLACVLSQVSSLPALPTSLLGHTGLIKLQTLKASMHCTKVLSSCCAASHRPLSLLQDSPG